MIRATAAPAALPSDLDALVPRSGRWRAVALGVLAAVALVAAWFSPHALRPSLDDGAGSAATSQVFPGQVLVVSESSVRAWPEARLEGVDDIPGARVAAAWLVDAEQGSAMLASDAEDPFAVLEATYPEADLPAGGNLPATFRTGDAVRLAILWDVDDCAALDEDAEAFATIRTALGTSVRTPLPWTARPDALLDPDLDDANLSLACRPGT